MQLSHLISCLPLLAITTLGAPSLLSSGMSTRTEPLDPNNPAFLCQAALKKGDCSSKTSTQSCQLAYQMTCNLAASDGANTKGRVSQTSGTCTATIWTGNVNPTLSECNLAFSAINANCILAGERPDPSKNLPNMRGWVNMDITKCMSQLDPNHPAYQMGSTSCDQVTDDSACNTYNP